MSPVLLRGDCPLWVKCGHLHDVSPEAANQGGCEPPQPPRVESPKTPFRGAFLWVPGRFKGPVLGQVAMQNGVNAFAAIPRIQFDLIDQGPEHRRLGLIGSEGRRAFTRQSA
jgi:hypothetical protein